MEANMQFTINSFRQLFPDKIFSLTIPWFLVKSLTFPWQLSNSPTFPGFPDKWSPCAQFSLTKKLLNSSENSRVGFPSYSRQWNLLCSGRTSPDAGCRMRPCQRRSLLCNISSTVWPTTQNHITVHHIWHSISQAPPYPWSSCAVYI